jgi:hypothetical protein
MLGVAYWAKRRSNEKAPAAEASRSRSFTKKTTPGGFFVLIALI